MTLPSLACPECASANGPDRRFCGECGARLACPCPSCGFANEAGVKFCGGCGHRLEAAPAPTQRVEGERRQVAILFADLAGYTRLSSELDPEDLHALIGEYFRRLDAIVTRYGGTVERHIGDAIMGVFGAPVAHDNDTLRAVRAGLEIHGALDAMSREFGRTLEGHVGIAAGEVVTAPRDRQGRHEFAVVGESVNLASRLSGQARGGEVLVTNVVHSIVASWVTAEVVGEIHVKGIDRPVKTWRILATREDRPVHSVRFVGRQRERRQFDACLGDCLAQGRGRSVLLQGEAGIGKSYLTEQLANQARLAGFAVHSSFVLDFGSTSGEDPIRRLAASLMKLAADSPSEARAEAAEALLAAGKLSAERRPFLYELLDLPQPLQMRALYDAMDPATRQAGQQRVLAELVALECEREPVLLVMEDVHWADPRQLAHIHALGALTRRLRLVLLMTSRQENSPLPHWPGEPLPELMEIHPLASDEAAALAASLAPQDSQFVLRCIERARGNPLFLEQLLRHGGGEEQEVPGSIQHLVLARLDRLAPEQRAVVQAAAVIGQRFEQAALRHLVGDQDYLPLLRDALFERVGDGLMFKHALIRDGAYASLLRSRRRDLHLKLADWYQGRDPALRAQHLDRADSPAAAQAYLEAARAMARLYRDEQALSLARRGIELAGDSLEKARLMLLEAELLRNVGAVAESLATSRQVLALTDDETLTAQAEIGLAAGMRLSDDLDGALASLERAQAIAQRLGLVGDLAQIHYLRGGVYFPRGNIQGCLEQHSEALRHARYAGLPEREAQALSGLGDAYYAQGRMRSAHGYFEQCLELCRHYGFGRIEAANRFMVATVRIYMHEPAAALEDALASAEMAAQVGNQRAEIVSRLTAGWILLDLCRDDEALEQAQRGLARAQALGARRFEPFLNESVARVRLRRGDRSGATALLEEALEYVRANAATFIGPWLLGTLALATPDPQQRRQALAEGEALLARGCVGHNYYRFYQAAMDACLAAAEPDQALAYASSLETFTRAEPVPWSDFHIRRCRALARRHLDQADTGAAAELDALADEARRAGLPVEGLA